MRWVASPGGFGVDWVPGATCAQHAPLMVSRVAGGAAQPFPAAQTAGLGPRYHACTRGGRGVKKFKRPLTEKLFLKKEKPF